MRETDRAPAARSVLQALEPGDLGRVVATHVDVGPPGATSMPFRPSTIPLFAVTPTAS